MVSPDQVGWFFASAPVAFGIVILAVTYAAKRHEGRDRTAPIGQALACANCGRREAREHMIPQQRDGGVQWLCSRCARNSR
jgi:CRISPR/Cas system-associated exonuclease Cas4 (RecB family)